jgi:hypothetical protein
VTPQSTLNVVTGLAQATLVLRAVETPPPGQNLTLQVKATSGSTTRTANLSVKTPVAVVAVLDEDFSGGIPDNWEVVINEGDKGWRDDDPGGRYEDVDWAPWGNIAPPFAIADSDWAGGVMDTELITPSLDLTGLSQASLRVDHKFVSYSGDESVRVDISLDGGSTWTNLVTYQGKDFVGQVVLDISSAAGQSNVKIRFHYANADDDWFWAVDNVRVLGF